MARKLYPVARKLWPAARILLILPGTVPIQLGRRKYTNVQIKASLAQVLSRLQSIKTRLCLRPIFLHSSLQVTLSTIDR